MKSWSLQVSELKWSLGKRILEQLLYFQYHFSPLSEPVLHLRVHLIDAL